ncbi:unnamed protein product [Haemonchus placei]|uniref:DET1- and DDB1-associated protein 1 n=1 Tax=Haemonchus placei TaxID=6290 RepID=A0A0N4VT64_HAEPC|nr:unnamed protein product [Haemonchus placei]
MGTLLGAFILLFNYIYKKIYVYNLTARPHVHTAKSGRPPPMSEPGKLHVYVHVPKSNKNGPHSPEAEGVPDKATLSQCLLSKTSKILGLRQAA